MQSMVEGILATARTSVFAENPLRQSFGLPPPRFGEDWITYSGSWARRHLLG